MSKERRRYFRINETLGVSYQVMGAKEGGSKDSGRTANLFDRVSEQDDHIERLLVEVGATHPKVAELAAVLNQKLERIVGELLVENRLVGRIAQRVKEANISACGIAFNNEESVVVGARLKMELSLFPGDIKLNIQGKVVGCDPTNDRASYYWRIEFYDVDGETQEQLIQHIVKRQSAQLKKMRHD